MDRYRQHNHQVECCMWCLRDWWCKQWNKEFLIYTGVIFLEFNFYLYLLSLFLCYFQCGDCVTAAYSTTSCTLLSVVAYYWSMEIKISLMVLSNLYTPSGMLLMFLSSFMCFVFLLTFFSFFSSVFLFHNLFDTCIDISLSNHIAGHNNSSAAQIPVSCSNHLEAGHHHTTNSTSGRSPTGTGTSNTLQGYVASVRHSSW